MPTVKKDLVSVATVEEAGAMATPVRPFQIPKTRLCPELAVHNGNSAESHDGFVATGSRAWKSIPASEVERAPAVKGSNLLALEKIRVSPGTCPVPVSRLLNLQHHAQYPVSDMTCVMAVS